jgi:hypothetical protein
MLIGLGLTAVGRLRLPGDAGKRSYSIVIGLITAALLAFLLVTQVRSLQGLANQPDDRIVVYKQVGNWLKDNTPEDISVGVLETGIIGFYSQRKMVDFAGLLYPDIANSLQDGGTFEKSALYALERYQPEVVVLQEGLFPTVEEGFMIRNCRPMKRLYEEPYPYHLVIYNCQ